jgi:acyl-CoA thioesterase-2
LPALRPREWVIAAEAVETEAVAAEAVAAEPSGASATAPRRLVAESAATEEAWVPVDVAALLAAFDLSAPGADRYTTRAPVETWPILPGSQQLGCSVVALERSMPGLAVTTLTMNFARPARPDEDSTVEVSPIHRGGSLGSGRVTWSQAGGVHSEGLGVLLRPEAPDFVAYRPAADLPPDPDVDPTTSVPIVSHHVPLDVRALQPTEADAARPVLRTWYRWESAPADPTLHRAMLAHLSETQPFRPVMSAYADVLAAHRTLASVVWHSLTIHEPVDLGQWHLVVSETDASGHGVASAQSRTYRADGLLVSTEHQTMVLRALEDRPG